MPIACYKKAIATRRVSYNVLQIGLDFRRFNNKNMTKDKFIGMYLDKAMKGHGLPYGFNYLNLLAVQEEKAEKAWNRFCKKLKSKPKN